LKLVTLNSMSILLLNLSNWLFLRIFRKNQA